MLHMVYFTHGVCYTWCMLHMVYVTHGVCYMWCVLRVVCFKCGVSYMRCYFGNELYDTMTCFVLNVYASVILYHRNECCGWCTYKVPTSDWLFT